MAFVTVAGRLLASHFQAGGEVPLTGQIFFTPTMEKVPTGEGVHLPAPTSVELDGDGRFEVELLSAGFSWEVGFFLRHAGAFVPVDCFNFLPEPGVDRVDFADIVPLTDPVTAEPMLRGADGVGISSVSAEGGKLRVATTDGQVTLLDLPAAEVDAATLQGYTTKAELIEALGQFTPPDVSPFTAGARYYSPVTYYWPDYYRGAESQWGKVLRFGENLGIVVMNRNSGDWAEYDKDFRTQAQLAKGAGVKRTIYYVKTQYGAAGNPGVWGAGVPDAAKYTKEYILGQLEHCKTHYPDTFEGVFLDEFINGWGDQEQRLSWYKELVDAIRDRFGKSFLIVGNCGSNCSESVLGLDVDVFMSFESTAAKYLEDAPEAPIHPAHMAKEPGTRFWHVVHDVIPENYQQVFAKAEELGIGHLYITDGKLVMGEGGQWQPDVNPYAVAPSQWIADLLRPWLRGMLDTRLKVEGLDARVVSLESAPPVKAETPTLAVGEVKTLPAGATATAEVTGESPDFVLSLGLPAGENGAPGANAPTPTLAVGTVDTGPASASITGTAPNYTLNLTLPAGGGSGSSSSVLMGAGRPDTPATLSVANQAAVSSAPVGATFTSTDGAGTGAWAWVKTPTGWAVTYGDTGWRDVTPMLQPGWSGTFTKSVFLKRIGDTCTLSYNLVPSTNLSTMMTAPAGFRSINVRFLGGANAPLQRDGVLNGAIYFDSPETIRGKSTSNLPHHRGGMNWVTTDPWPATLPGTPA